MSPFAPFERWLEFLDSTSGLAYRVQHDGKGTEFDMIALLPTTPGQTIFTVGNLRKLVEAGRRLKELETKEFDLPELFMPSLGEHKGTIFIARGVPGCGKSHRAARLKASFDFGGSKAEICSADFYFGDGDDYRKNWSREKAHLGHKDCETRVKQAIKDGYPNIIVDNTNINLQAFRVYIDIAVDNNYAVNFVYPDSPWWTDMVEPFLRNKMEMADAATKASEIASILAQKTVHGVPPFTIADMLMRFQWVTFKDYVEATKQRLASMEKDVESMQDRVALLKKHLLENS